MHVNKTLWTDTLGKPIQAHGGGLLHLDGVWYWYGEVKSGPTRRYERPNGDPIDRVEVVGVAGYRSADLLNWEPMGVVLKTIDAPHHDLSPMQVMERPKVIFHKPTGTFVMWLHIDWPDYKLAAAGVAVSDRPEGPFTYLGSIRPQGRDSRDQTVFMDDDGAAYHFCSTDMNASTLVTRLSDNYRSLSGESKTLFPDRHMEAHAITKAYGRYWYIASGCTGWAPNPARSAVAGSVWGPWEELDNPCRGGEQPDMTWGTQSTYLQTLPNGRVLAMFDCWKPKALGTSSYVWITADVSNNEFELNWQPQWHGLSGAVALKGRA
jgi:hypothetical protein